MSKAIGEERLADLNRTWSTQYVADHGFGPGEALAAIRELLDEVYRLRELSWELHGALRTLAIPPSNEFDLLQESVWIGCELCGRAWPRKEPENHPGCLAAPLEDET